MVSWGLGSRALYCYLEYPTYAQTRGPKANDSRWDYLRDYCIVKHTASCTPAETHREGEDSYPQGIGRR